MNKMNLNRRWKKEEIERVEENKYVFEYEGWKNDIIWHKIE